MSSSEPQPENKEPEGEGQGTSDEPNLADFLTPAYIEHLKEFFTLIPPLEEVRACVPEGTTLKMEDWIFPVLAKCRELSGAGVAIRIGDVSAFTWLQCFGAGMPQDMPPINLYLAAETYHEKYKDFAIHAQGVLDDPENSERGKSAWRWVYTHPITGKEFTIHLWRQTIYLRNSTTQIIGHYNSGTNPDYSDTLQMGKGIRIEMTDLQLSDPASSHLLVDSTVLLTDSQQILDAALAEPQPREVRIDRESVRNLIRNTAKALHLERIERPFSMLAPKPRHFPQYSKLEGKPCLAEPVMCSGLEIEALHNHYGFPRGLPQTIFTYQGKEYGPEFADFTIEYFGLQGNTSQEDEVTRISERKIGKHKVSKVEPDGLPYGSGGTLSMLNLDADGACIVKIYVWRWRIFMDKSSLCLELNWHHDDATVGGWIPYLLGIDYSDPEKAVADGIRFAPAFKLCNLVEAKLLKIGGDTRPKEIQQIWADNNVLKGFVHLVNELRPSWNWIKTNVEHSASMSLDRQQEWVSDMWQRDEVKIFAARHPKFTREVLARAVDGDLNKVDRAPTSLACWHAALEYEVNVNGESLSLMDGYSRYKGKKPAPSTVRGWYDKAANLPD